MTTKTINKLATAMVKGVRRVSASPKDARVLSGELISEKQAHKMAASALRKCFREIERALNEAVQECAGKPRSQIATIMRRKLDAIQKPTL
jgi:hypothetical protein